MNKNMMQVVWVCILMVLNIATVSAAGDETLFSKGGVPSQNTKFNYQGEVIYNGSPANGVFDVRFKLFDDLIGGSELISEDQTITIVDGLLNAELDFGDFHFNNQPLWLEILIEQPTIPGFFILNPRVPINTAPHAIQSIFVASNSINSASIQNGSVENIDIGALQISNSKIANGTIDFSKLADNGAANGDVIQFNGSAWVSAPAAGGSSPWSSNVNGINYSAGNVGIGTSTPTGLLHLNGTSADELSLYGVNSTPVIHFRRLNGNVDWVMKQSSDGTKFHIQTELADGNEVLSLTSSGRLGLGTVTPDGFLDVKDAAGDTLLNVKDDGSIQRKSQTRTTYVSFKSFVPESNVYTYSTLNFLGMTGLHSTYTGGGPAKFHADVSLPADAVITQFEVMAGDNSGSGAVTAKFGYRVFGTSNGVITLSTLTSTNSPFGEVMSDTLNTVVGNDRSYFVDVDIDNVTTAGQEVMFAGLRVTYETTSL